MKRLLIHNPSSFQLQAPDTGRYIAGVQLHAYKHGIDSVIINPRKGRIHQQRNVAVDVALREGFDRILMVDPDMNPDCYLAAGQIPFFPTAWEFLDENPGCVAAAPYCGPWPDRPIHVFGCDPANGDKLFRCSHGFSQWREGWHDVAAVGTGLMLIDASIFQDLTTPYFFDRYRDETQTALEHSQDVVFCKRVRESGHKIFVNFSCWASHWQNSIVDAPGLEGQRDGEVNLNVRRNREEGAIAIDDDVQIPAQGNALGSDAEEAPIPPRTDDDGIRSSGRSGAGDPRPDETDERIAQGKHTVRAM